MATLLTSFLGASGGRGHVLKLQELNVSLKNGQYLHFQKVLHFPFHQIMESCTSFY